MTTETLTEQEKRDAALVERLELVLLEALAEEEPAIACSALFSTLVRVMQTVNPTENAFEQLIDLCQQQGGQ